MTRVTDSLHLICSLSCLEVVRGIEIQLPPVFSQDIIFDKPMACKAAACLMVVYSLPQDRREEKRRKELRVGVRLTDGIRPMDFSIRRFASSQLRVISCCVRFLFLTAKPFPWPLFLSLFRHVQDTSTESDLKSLMSGVYAKDWVNDFVEPDESVIEEGRKTIDFLLKR